MQIIKTFTKLAVFLCPFFVNAQSTYLNQGDKSYQLIDRLEIKQQTNPDLNFSSVKPYSRKYIVEQMDSLSSRKTALTNVDKQNLNSLLMNNSEWVNGSTESFLSKHPFLIKSLYKTKPNMLEVNVKDFFLAVNPVFDFNMSSSDKMFVNTKGATIRGMIAKKLGFVTSVTDNQERGPKYFQDYVTTYRAVPGNGFYKSFKTDAVDYFDARGYISFSAVKHYVDVQFGYDKNFIGNGYRSLFLSDWGNSYLFLKLNTKIWKFNYQNLFMELMPQFTKTGDNLLDRKYAAMHHLSINLSKSVNVGLFEGIVFGRKNSFELQYLNPVIFLRHAEGTVGSPDNAVAGFDFKANIVHRVQFYGQILLDEFKLDKIKENKGWWANKWGIQAGAKYIDAFGISNLDLQIETNIVRPYTYSHYDSVANYTHYNQPLAHPLGANFEELIGILKYQPLAKLYINAKLIYYKQGLDSANYNSGSNIFRDYTDRYGIDEGYKIGGGRQATCINGILQVSYELKQNLFLDLSLQHRRYTLQNSLADNVTIISAGIRLNIFRREYDF